MYMYDVLAFICIRNNTKLIANCSIPMQKGFAPEHNGELFGDSFENFLNSRWIANECRWHFQATRWNITNGHFHIIRNPLDEVAAIFILNCKNLWINLFHWHFAYWTRRKRTIKKCWKIARQQQRNEGRVRERESRITRVKEMEKLWRIKKKEKMLPRKMTATVK